MDHYGGDYSDDGDNNNHNVDHKPHRLDQYEVVSYVEVPIGVSAPICGTLSEKALKAFGNANSLEDMILVGWSESQVPTR